MDSNAVLKINGIAEDVEVTSKSSDKVTLITKKELPDTPIENEFELVYKSKNYTFTPSNISGTTANGFIIIKE